MQSSKLEILVTAEFTRESGGRESIGHHKHCIRECFDAKLDLNCTVEITVSVNWTPEMIRQRYSEVRWSI